MNEEPKEFLDLWHARHVPYEGPMVEGLDDMESILCVMSTLSPREFEVLYLRFFLDFTLQECSHVTNVCRDRVRQIELKALRKLRHDTRVDLWFRTGLVDDIVENRKRLRKIQEESRKQLDLEFQAFREQAQKEIRKRDQAAHKLRMEERARRAEEIEIAFHIHRMQQAEFQEIRRKHEHSVPDNIELRFCGWFPYLWIDPSTGLKCARYFNPEIYDKWINIKLKQARSTDPGTSS